MTAIKSDIRSICTAPGCLFRRFECHYNGELFALRPLVEWIEIKSVLIRLQFC
jgi:hypothetical protein